MYILLLFFSFTNAQDFNHRRFPILCNATMESPFSQYPETFAYDTAADNISSVVSVSVARADPSAKSGIKPLVNCACFAGVSPEHIHVKESVVNVGTNTVNTGTFGLYFATSLAVLPPCVKTTIKAARTFAPCEPRMKPKILTASSVSPLVLK